MKKLKLIINTVRYLKLTQILHRVKYEADKKLKRKIRIRRYTNPEGVCMLRFFPSDFSQADINDFEKHGLIDTGRVNGILQNEFTFLNNLSYRFERAIDWKKDPYNYRLWNFNLNYFDYLLDLSDACCLYKREEYVLKGFELIYNWIDENLWKYDHDLWDGYAASKRVVNWIVFYLSNREGCKNSQMLIDGINTHAHFIYGNVEYYLDANHILMNARALVFCGIFLRNDRILKRGLRIFKKEFHVQFLPDGGHFERSASYHVEVLSHYLEATLLLLRNGYGEEGVEWRKRLITPFDYLCNIMMFNGEIPLVNDSALDYPYKANELLECAAVLYGEHKYRKFGGTHLGLYGRRLLGKSGCKTYENMEPAYWYLYGNSFNSDTGYMIIRDKIEGDETYLLFDCGDGGPDYNLGHAHADALNVIFAAGKRKVFADSGVFTYKRGSERDYFRSTAAHNTVCIDGLSSSNIWKSFRIAERSRTRLLKLEESEDYILIVAEHDGYTKVLKGDRVFHKRSILCIKNNGFVIVDTLYGKISRKHSAVLHYHLGSDEVRRVDANTLEIDNRTRVFFSHPYEIDKAQVSEVFNIRKEMPEVTVTTEFTGTINLLTGVSFTGWKFDVEELDHYSVIVNYPKRILYDLKNHEVKVGEGL